MHRKRLMAVNTLSLMTSRDVLGIVFLFAPKLSQGLRLALQVPSDAITELLSKRRV